MGDNQGRIVWSRLKENTGNPAAIPELLRACADQDAVVAATALDELDTSLYYVGGWVCSAAVAALPFLVELAGEATHHRKDVVELIGRLAHEANTVPRRMVARGWPAALDAERPRLLELLADPDPLVRREATMVAGQGIRHLDSVAALRERWRLETNRVTRWDLVLAMGAASTWHEPLREELARLLDHDDLQIRLAAVHGLAESTPAFAASHVELVVRAVRHPDAALWQESAWIGGDHRTIVRTIGDLLQSDPVASTAFARGVHLGDDTDARVASMAQTARVLAEWRTATSTFLPFLADHLDDDAPKIRYQAAYLLACLGIEAAEHADKLAARVSDPGLEAPQWHATVGDAAVWALARMNDPRCVPGLVERLTGDRLAFAETSNYIPREDVGPVFLPGIHEVLIPLQEHAHALVDAVAARLAAPDQDRFFVSNLCEVIAAWGPAAQAAAPVLVQLLDRDDVFPAAAKALGGIGPAAAGCADTLRDKVDSPEAAWALWRMGVDPDGGTLIRYLTKHPHDEELRNADLGLLTPLARFAGRHPARDVIRLLADLGPLAASKTGFLRRLTLTGNRWTRVEAAHALWRVTGDPTRPVAVLTRLARPLSTGDCEPVRLDAMRYLADIGARTEPVLTIARAIAANPRRLANHGDWRAFTEDEALRAAAGALLD